MPHTNCWYCGFKLEEGEEIVRRGKHTYCDDGCAVRGEHGDPDPSDEPIDYDQHDRNAAESERLDNLRRER